MRSDFTDCFTSLDNVSCTQDCQEKDGGRNSQGYLHLLTGIKFVLSGLIGVMYYTLPIESAYVKS